MVVFGTWAGDTVAYFTGKLLRRHADGAAALAQEDLGGLRRRLHRHRAHGRLHRPVLPLASASCTRCCSASTIAVVGPLGDLFEILLKRDVEIKDAGRGFPGHGGVLDRFDGLLWASVASYFVLKVALGL